MSSVERRDPVMESGLSAQRAWAIVLRVLMACVGALLLGLAAVVALGAQMSMDPQEQFPWRSLVAVLAAAAVAIVGACLPRAAIAVAGGVLALLLLTFAVLLLVDSLQAGDSSLLAVAVYLSPLLPSAGVTATAIGLSRSRRAETRLTNPRPMPPYGG